MLVNNIGLFETDAQSIEHDVLIYSLCRPVDRGSATVAIGFKAHRLLDVIAGARTRVYSPSTPPRGGTEAARRKEVARDRQIQPDRSRRRRGASSRSALRPAADRRVAGRRQRGADRRQRQRLTKAGGCNGCADAGGSSVQRIAAGDGTSSSRRPRSTTLRFVGISTTRSHDYPAFPWSIKLGSGGVAEVRESNVYRAETAFVPNDVFRIAIVSGRVRYSKNGAPAFYTSEILPSYPVYAVASLLTASATFGNAMIGGSASLSPWQTQDVGTVGLAGSASQSAGVFTGRGAGADIWGTAEAIASFSSR